MPRRQIGTQEGSGVGEFPHLYPCSKQALTPPANSGVVFWSQLRIPFIAPFSFYHTALSIAQTTIFQFLVASRSTVETI